ncbi:MAG TPA: uL13 family ribosomal protein, partial [bacterium]|nr:uL13 family ribosomal protein [bacterium]
MGGLREINAKKLLDKDPGHIITAAVKGMLPRGPLGRKQLKKLKVYAGSEHPHSAQKPLVIEL